METAKKHNSLSSRCKVLLRVIKGHAEEKRDLSDLSFIGEEQRDLWFICEDLSPQFVTVRLYIGQ